MTKPKILYTIPDVVDRFRAYYRANPTWGILHIVLEDGNTRTKDVEWCWDHAYEIGDMEGENLAFILLYMSRTQRSKLARMV